MGDYQRVFNPRKRSRPVEPPVAAPEPPPGGEVTVDAEVDDEAADGGDGKVDSEVESDQNMGGAETVEETVEEEEDRQEGELPLLQEPLIEIDVPTTDPRGSPVVLVTVAPPPSDSDASAGSSDEEDQIPAPTRDDIAELDAEGDATATEEVRVLDSKFYTENSAKISTPTSSLTRVYERRPRGGLLPCVSIARGGDQSYLPPRGGPWKCLY